MGGQSGLREANPLNKGLCQIPESRKVGSTIMPPAVGVKFGNSLKSIILAIAIVTPDGFQRGKSPLHCSPAKTASKRGKTQEIHGENQKLYYARD